METLTLEEIEETYSSQIKEYMKEHQEWKERFLIKDKEKADFQERQYHLLIELLPSAFLIHEEILNEKDVQQSIRFIRKRKILKEFVSHSPESYHYWGAKLALLHQIFPLQCNNLKFKHLEHLNNYLTTYQDELSKKAILDFLRFITLIQLCYDDYLKFLETELTDPAEKNILNRIFNLVDKGDWKLPATRENIKDMLKTCLLRNVHYKKTDKESCEKFWHLLKKSGGNQVNVIFMNLIGYFWKRGCLEADSGPDLKEMFFGNREKYTNIDKGVPGNPGISKGFREIIGFLDDHLPR